MKSPAPPIAMIDPRIRQSTLDKYMIDIPLANFSRQRFLDFAQINVRHISTNYVHNYAIIREPPHSDIYEGVYDVG